jgi:hypothetical protein
MSGAGTSKLPGPGPRTALMGMVQAETSLVGGLLGTALVRAPCCGLPVRTPLPGIALVGLLLAGCQGGMPLEGTALAEDG